MSPALPESRHFDPILRPDLEPLLAARARRLRALAEGHELADYLRYAAAICDARAAAMTDMPPARTFDPAWIATNGSWPTVLKQILRRLHAQVPAAAEPHLAALAACDDVALRAMATNLVAGNFAQVDPAHGPLIWAALSAEVAEAARALPLPARLAEESAFCPICGSAPVASHIHNGERQGMRYLHCALCDCEWHVVRAKCSNCGESGRLEYLSFDTPEAPIRAETCGDCGGYLKVISSERDANVEVVADDLASLVLDDAAVGEGFGRSGFNPFALPGCQ